MLKYSIISICKNCKKDLLETLNSIKNQEFDMNTVEIIVIDGNSTDGTAMAVELFRNENKHINLTFVSENDRGIYDAMNKGVKNANGEWCVFLNAGDLFYNSFALQILNKASDPKYDIVYGDAIHKYKNKGKIVTAKNERDITYLHGMEFCHQSAAIKREYLIANPYSLEYRIAGDCDFFTKAFKNGARFKHTQGVVAVFSKDGISSKLGYMVEKENAMVLYKYGLIEKAEYTDRLNKAEKKERVRKILPNFVVSIRQKMIMNHTVSKWDDFNNL